MKCLVSHFCFQVVFLFKKYFYSEILINLVKKTKQKYVFPKGANCIFAIANFDLWMFKGAHNIFTLVVNFLGTN
jgi:hypothetical protein